MRRASLAFSALEPVRRGLRENQDIECAEGMTPLAGIGEITTHGHRVTRKFPSEGRIVDICRQIMGGLKDSPRILQWPNVAIRAGG